MSLSRIIDSCRRFNEYPSNLIDAGPIYPSILREYQQRRTRRADQLFCPEGRAAVEYFRYEESPNGFRSNTTASLHNLSQYLPCATGHTQKEKSCTFVFVGAQTSRDPLQISQEMMLWVLSIFQTLPTFLDFIFPFGRQLHAVDFQFSGFRQDNRFEAGFQRQAIPELGRSGRDFQICYNLKTVEPKPSQSWPWSCRQTALFHSFDVDNGLASWIVIKANNLIRERLKEVSNHRLGKDSALYKSVSKMFDNTLASHMVVVEWAGENWRWYINYFEEQLDTLKRRAIVDKVTHSTAHTVVSGKASSGFPTTIMSPKKTWTWRGAFSRTSTVGSQVATTTLMQNLQPLPMNGSVIEPEDPPDLPPEYDPQFQDQGPEEDESEYKIDELQNAQHLESKANEAILVLKSNIRILSHLQNCYERLPESRDLDQALRDDFQASVSSFVRRIQSTQSDLQIHLERLETIAKLIAECQHLLYGIVEYQSMQANKKFAQEAQRSAERMEGMTKKMQDLTLKTTLETVLMRIITVVTVFFLPATFVSTLMSTDIVHFESQNSGMTSGKASLGAVKLFLCLSFSLMFATFGAGFGLYWWAVRYADH